MNLNKKIIYGTMRMLSVKRSVNDWIYIFDELSEKGINSFHISKEYKSYNMFQEILKKSKINKNKVNIYAKCYSPNFNEQIYDEKKLNSLLDYYLKDLKINCLNMQWMWRGSLYNENLRCRFFQETFGKVDYSFSIFKKKKVKEIYCFPYTTRFAKLANTISSIDGLSVYFNPKENSYRKILEKKNIGIRPLYAGNIFNKYSFEYLMNFSLKENKIEKTILSINKKKNFKKLYDYLDV